MRASSDGTHAVRFDRVSRTYNLSGRPTEALRQFSLVVERGEVAAIVGPNGAGKTTALRIAATLVEPSSGRVAVCGHDVVAEPVAVRGLIGVSLGSSRSFYWRLTARENLRFFARLRLLRGRRVGDEIERAADALGLADLLDVPARRLSRGALARLSVARAVLGSPSVLLLDEPFASLDGEGRKLAVSALKREAARGCGVVVTAHEAPAGSLCSKAAALAAGGPR